MDNTVGSLTQLQRSVIIGSILGDGYVRIVPGRKNAFLEINHAYSAKQYVDWKYEILRNISKSAPVLRHGNGARMAYRFYTRQHQEITELFELFYHNGKKFIPDSFELNPIILAIWYMDDGSYCRSSDIYLNTQQFTLDDQTRLIGHLGRIGIEARMNRDKKYFRLRIMKSSIPRLIALIENVVIPSMQYKLGYNPVETCSNHGTDSCKICSYNMPAPSLV